MLIGNVGKDPDVRYFEQDQAVAQVRLATTERGYTLQNGTQVPDRTDWHNLVFYRQLAKIVEEILVDNMEMLSPKPQTTDSDMASEPAPQPQANDNQMPF